MIKAVLFDLDDTLISELDYVKSGFSHISEILHERLKRRKAQTYDLLIELFNEDSKNVFNRLFERLNIDYCEGDISKLVEAYRGHTPNICFYEDVVPTIKRLKENNVKTGVITDGFKESQRKKLDSLNAYSLFDRIILTDELGRTYWKPHPRSFEMMRETFHAGFHEMMYVGDNEEKDFYISKKYPIVTVKIIRQKSDRPGHEYLGGIKEQISIRSTDEILAYIDRG